jgi:hypothetical protein
MKALFRHQSEPLMPEKSNYLNNDYALRYQVACSN